MLDEALSLLTAALPFVYAGTAVVTVSLAVLTWRNRHARGSDAIVGVLVAITGWLLATIAGGLADGERLVLAWDGVALGGLSLTVALLFVFALRHAGYEDVLSGRRALVLAVQPVLITALALTNDGTGIAFLGLGGHELVYESFERTRYANSDVDWGVGFWLHTAYAYVLVATSTVLVLKTTLTSNDTYRWQSVTIAVAILVPWVANALDLAVDSLDGLLALGFGVSAILLTVSIQRFEFSKLAPVARPVVMEAVADGVLVVDDRGRIVDANDRARRFLGLDDVDVLGATASDVLPAALAGFLDAETAPARERVAYSDRTLEVETTPFGDGGESGRVFVVRDVTEQHAYREELERKTERLDRFASVVSHDLRNPLSVARGYADIAEDTGDPEAFERVHDAHDRMDSLIDDVLLMAREGETSTDPEPVALADLAERAWATVDTADATLDAPADAAVRADPDRTVQLFENLFRNSVEHGGPDVAVTVGMLDDGGGFYVADDGTGLPGHVDDDLFETGVTGADGTGLGLAIVDRIATAHGWTTDATGSAADGARFEFRGVDADVELDDDPEPLPDDPFAD
jgi:PAS domain S-box-containing protein